MRPQWRSVIVLLVLGVEMCFAASNATTVAVPFPVTLAQAASGAMTVDAIDYTFQML